MNRSAARAAKSLPEQHLLAAFERVRLAAEELRLPEVKESTSYGTPSLAVRGKSMLRLKDADTLVLMCALDEKEMLMEGAPDIYFETDHYKGWPAVLIRLANISDAELTHRIGRAWRMRAPKRLLAAHDATRPSP
jgi:hypothetical protein